MIKSSEFAKFKMPLKTDNLPVLRGFGNSVVQPTGKFEAQVTIDGVDAIIELLIVPDDVMRQPILIGQTFTELPFVVVLKTNNFLEISQLSNTVVTNTKVKLVCTKDLSASGLAVVEVYTVPEYEGDLFIEHGYRNNNNTCYSVLSGIYHIGKGGVGKIAVTCSDKDHVILRGGSIIARGILANEESDCNEMHVSKIQNLTELEPIKLSDIKFGSQLNGADQQKLLELLNKYRDCFAFNISELGQSNVTEMSIVLKNDEPVVYRPYRLAMKEKEIVREIVGELLEHEMVRPSTSAYASPIVLVRKKTGDYSYV